uniref:Uncharacterized protein n=1 Tax=Avena sativa TaxID=4498 RepID=A0ACD6A5M0_AVESA
MAKVPDLGSDFAQKLLLDLRRRRERLGFGSAAAAQQQQQQQQQRTTSSAAAPRDARSSSQKPLRSQKPQQAAPAPRARAPEAKAAPRSSSYQKQQPGNATAAAGKPRRRRDVAPVAAANGQAIVPYQGGGGGGGAGGGGKPKHVVASNVDVQRMAALALALSDGGKLRNIEIMARNGSVFLRGPDTPAHHRGGVAIGVQDLNDMLMAAYSSGVHSGRKRSDEAGKKRLFRGSMDMEEALSMLVMLQDASGYVEGSGSGKVLLLKDKENRESSATTTTRGSARIVEIVDEESETEEAKNASMQIVVHDKFVQSHQSPNRNSSPVMQQTGPTDSKTSSASHGEKDGSKVRMPSVIAKLMGLENLPSSAPKTVVERKGTERFVKPESVPRMEIRANAMDRKLPIRIVASEKVLSKGQHKILLPGEWKSSSLTDFGEPQVSNSSSHPATGNKHVRLTMRDVLRKMVGAERGADGSQGVDERIIHEDKAFTEEIKLQKPVSVGCRSSDAGKKMDFLKRFRKNSDNRPAMEDKQHISQEKSAPVGKKQATGMKRLLGRDSEAKSRRAREKLNKENQATAETKVAASAKNGKADQMKRQAQSKQMDRQTTPRKARNCRETQSRNLEDKKPLTSEAAHMKKKPGYAIVIQPKDEEHAEVNDISSNKPSGSPRGVGSFPEELAIVVRGSSSTAGEASSDKILQKITEATSDLTIPEQTVVRESEDLKFLDQVATSEVHVRDSSRTGAASSDQPLQEVTEGASEELKFMNQNASSETHVPETFTDEEHQQQTQQHQQQQMIVKEQPTDGTHIL